MPPPTSTYNSTRSCARGSGPGVTIIRRNHFEEFIARLIGSALALPLAIGTRSRRSPDGVRQGDYVTEVKYSSEFLAKCPDAPGDLVEAVRGRQALRQAVAKVFLTSADHTTVELLNVEGDPLTTSASAGPDTAVDVEGKNKRVRGTPLPMWMYLSAWVAGAVAVGIGAVVLLFAVSVPAFGLHIYVDSLLPAIVTLLLGAACLSAIGVAVATLVKSVDQAQPVVQLTFLPLSFISGIWFPLDGAPDWLVSVAEAFPLYHLAQAFGSAFTPNGGWEPQHLAVLAIWTVGALLIAARRFRAED